MKKKILFLFTATYPFGEGESFIENEIHYLSAEFDKIIIISNTKNGFNRAVPNNIITAYFDYNLSFFEKISALKGLFGAHYKNEKEIIINTYHLNINKNIKNIALTSLFKAKKIKKIIYRLRLKYTDKNDKIYLYSYWMNDMATGCAYAKSKDDSLIFISRAHGWDVYFERHTPPYLPARKFIAQQANHLFFISKQGLDYFVQKNAITDTRSLKISYLGTSQRNKKAYCRNDKAFKIVSCSSIIPLKQVDKIAEALSFLDNRYSIDWTHIGGGAMQNQIENKIHALLNDKKHIRWTITGNMQNEEVLKFYDNNSIDLFINASLFEGLPVSIMEAFSYGIPAIAPNIGGISEIIDNEENGFIFSADMTSEKISFVIKKIIDMSEFEYLSFRDKAYNKWQLQFNAEKNFTNFIKNFV